MHRSSLRLICLSITLAAVTGRGLRADMTVEQGTTETLSGTVAPGTVTMKSESTLKVEPSAEVTGMTVKFDGKLATLDIGAGARLSGGGFTWGGGSNYGANAISNTVTVTGPGTVWDGPVMWTRNYTQPNEKRGDKWSQIVLTNGVEFRNATFGSNVLDSHGGSWYLNKAKLELAGTLSMNYADHTTIEIADEAALVASQGITINGTENRLLLRGANAAFVGTASLSACGTSPKIAFLDGATGLVSSVTCGTAATRDALFRLAGTGTRLVVTNSFSLGDKNSQSRNDSDCRLVVEDGATLEIGSRLDWGYNLPASNNGVVIRNGAAVVTASSFNIGGRYSDNDAGYFGTSGTNDYCCVSNATLTAGGGLTYSSSALSNALEVVDGATVTANTMRLAGPSARLEIRNASVVLTSGFATDGKYPLGTEDEPASIWLSGTNATLQATTIGEMREGTNVIGNLGFRIAAEGRSTDQAFIRLTGGYQSNANHIFPETLKLRLDIDSRWARSGDANTIDLIDFCGDKNRTSDRTGFYALTNDVSAAELKGCTLEYVTSSSGKAKGCLRLRAGKAVKGLMILLK